MGAIEVTPIEEASPGLQFVEVEVTSTELKALHTTAKLLVAGVPGRTIVPELVYYEKAAGTAYAGSRNLTVQYATANSVVISSATNGFTTLATLAQRFQFHAGALEQPYPGEGIEVALSAALTTGTGNLKVRLYFRLYNF